MNISEIQKEFDEKFPCINANCDNKGSIPVLGDDGDVEAEKCQYCFEIRFPQRYFIKEQFTKLLDSILIEEELKIQEKVEEKAREIVVSGRMKVAMMLKDKHIRQGKMEALLEVKNKIEELKK